MKYPTYTTCNAVNLRGDGNCRKVRQARTSSIHRALLILLLLFVGCTPTPRDWWPVNAVETLDQLYRRHLTEEPERARATLKECITFIESVRAHGRSHVLWLGYARLFALETAAGNHSEASRYFSLSAQAYHDKLLSEGESPEEVSAALAKFTPTWCLELVWRCDDNPTQGRGPKYWNAAHPTQ